MDSFYEILRSAWGIALAAIFFGGTIFIHELGHFLAAKRRGLKVERFSIGFGPKIWGWTGKDGVDYRLSLFPFGGYVALPQMADMSAIEGDTEDDAEKLPKIGYADKMIVAVMGATFNILFAIVLACVLWAFGRPEIVGNNSTVIGYIDSEIALTPGGEKVKAPATKTDLRLGDKILAVDGTPVATFTELVTAVALSSGRDAKGEPHLELTIERDGKTLQHPLGLTPVMADRNGGGDRMRTLGIRGSEPVYADLPEGSRSPAAKAGLKSGDRILTVNGVTILSFEHFKDAIATAGTSPMTVTVERKVNGAPVRTTLTITPEIIPATNPLLALEFGENGIRRRVELVPVPEHPTAPKALKAPRVNLMVRDGPPADSAYAEALATGNVLYALDASKGAAVRKTADFPAVLAATRGAPAEPVTLYLKNDEGRALNVTIPGATFAEIPAKMEPAVGIGMRRELHPVHRPPWEYLADTAATTLRTLRSLVAPSSDVSLKNLTGVIGIARIYYDIADSILNVVWFTVLINVNLAVMNLLPLPVLDGGHMVYATYEKIRGRPLHRRVVEILQTSFVVILFSLMAFVLWQDVRRLRSGLEAERKAVVDAYVERPVEFPTNAK